MAGPSGSKEVRALPGPVQAEAKAQDALPMALELSCYQEIEPKE